MIVQFDVDFLVNVSSYFSYECLQLFSITFIFKPLSLRMFWDEPKIQNKVFIFWIRVFSKFEKAMFEEFTKLPVPDILYGWMSFLLI